MKSHNLLIRLITIIVLIMIVFTCSKKPTEPQNNNPFDPTNTSTAGDPFQLTAQIANGGITLNWNKPGIEGLSSFKIYRSEQENSGYNALQTVNQNAGQHVDQSIENGHSYWYLVSALNISGEETQRTNTAAVNIKTEPLLVINGGAQYTTLKTVSLTILANTARQMLLSNSADFGGANWEDYATGKSWTLLTGEGQKTVYMKVKYENANESNTVSNSITLDMTPPNLILTVSPDTGITSETNFQFDPTQSSDNLSPLNDLQIRFDWENDGTWDTGWQLCQMTNYQYPIGGGDKMVKMELRDSAGWTVDTTAQIFVNTPPVAQFTAAQDQNNLSLFHFDASASFDYEDGSNLQYRWDWENDGVWDTGFSSVDTISHQYSNSGQYTVNLQVRDSGNLTNFNTEIIFASFLIVEWVNVPAGPYTYGNPPQTLTINYDYQIMKYEVTNQQYVTYLEAALAVGEITVTSSSVQGYYIGDQHWAAGNYEFLNLDDPDCRISYSGGSFSIDSGYENHPVVEVSWFGANAMAEHHGLSLPTEQEWEKAARGNTGWDYSWGDNIDGSRANYWNSGDPFDNGTTPVGYYNGSNHGGFQTTDSPSPFGAYDMAGNVWEWCDSFWSGTSSYRVGRGGSWGYNTYFLQSWNRVFNYPTYGDYDIGFRCSRN